MSADAIPIIPSRFAAALKDLSLSSLHLKVLELRNSIAHLDYSNEQLRPFAEGTIPVAATTITTPTALATTTNQQTNQQSQQEQETKPEPDQDCIDAIRENEDVIARMQERIRLIRAEVEDRGFSWTEFQDVAADAAEAAETANDDNDDDDDTTTTAAATTGGGTANGVGASTTTATTNGANGVTSPWTDGTFQTGVIRNGQIQMDATGVAGSRQAGAQQGGGRGGSLTDEELRRRMEEQLRGLGDGDGDEDDEEGGLHL